MPRFLVGMGIVKEHFYVADNFFNLVRVPVRQFVLASGEGGQMRASLNLTADAQVVNYQHRFGNLSLPEETIKELSYQMSVFFVRGSSSASEHLLFPYDAFAFFVRIKPNPPFLLFSSLEDLEESLVRKEVFIKKGSKNDYYTLLSADDRPMVLFTEDKMGFIDRLIAQGEWT